METVAIYFSDLTEDKQRELLNAYGVNDYRELNWDVFPVDIIEIYDTEEL